jgi:hypothetical protein
MHPRDVGRDLGTAQDEADLRTVSVPDGDVPTLFDHIGDVMRRLTGCLVLILNGLMLLVWNQRIAANGDDGPFAFRHVNLLVFGRLVG